MPRQPLLFLTAAICLATLLPILAQQSPKDVSAIEKAINAENYKTADSLLKIEVAAFITAGDLDTLVHYIPLAGTINNKQHGPAKASEAVFKLIDLLKSKNAPPALLVDACRAAAEFFSTVGLNKNGYEASEKALAYTMLKAKPTPLEIARCEYNLGIYAHRLGNVGLSQLHQRRALEIRERERNTPAEDIYLSANAMGSLMWYGSRYDSATLFFERALAALKNMPPTPINKYFRPANIQNNMAAVFSAEGKTTEAIKAMEITISNYQQFIDTKEPDPKKGSATEGLFEAIDNLAGIYREIGDFGKAGELLRYSYQKKLQKLDAANPGIFISEILLGQHYQGIHEYDTAIHYLTAGLDKLEKAEGDYLFWAGDAYYNLAMIFENEKDNAKAAAYYKRSEQLYEQSYQGEYDNVYMDFLRNASLFYAKNNNYPAAIERAEKVYNYLVNIGEGASLQAFYQTLNIAEINYLTNRYQEAIRYSTNALAAINAKMKDGITLLDSVKMEVFKPKAILINAKSEYVMRKDQDTAFLTGLLSRLGDAMNILQKRKVLIDDAASINILINDHQELIDFAKKIELQLYEQTGKALHLDKFINLHESALYNRIRGRLDKQQAIRFSQLPDSIQSEEDSLKAGISASLRSGRANNELINDYLKAVDRWELHLDKVKKNYPAYYNMRYATLFRSIPELQSHLADSNTVIRYFYNNEKLMALIIDRNNKKLVTIDNAGLEQKIAAMLNTAGEKQQLSVLYEIYQQVWAPVAPFVHTRAVMIIPDGILYNLSFDMLPSKPIGTYNELLSNSLLSRHSFSYHYSLFMLNQPEAKGQSKNNYVGFTPGFSDEVKYKYRAVVKDSINLDHKYLKLLPQPNTRQLAKKIRDMIGGDVFLDEQSTQTSFKQNAGGHAIIHIGTHAEYNNIHPEQSGLLFSKNIARENDDNFLSLYDIYNCDMNSELTLLTACESGRPGYQDGEGMVSLAHAFNYAGSQRILTALWKVDEQSSSLITEFFIQNLKNGQATDEALRQAKLLYLQQAHGRTLAPAYWAGLVIMGEPTQLTLRPAAGNTYWIIGAIMALLILVAVLLKSRSKKGAVQ